MVRDTTDRPGPILTFTADAWRAFMASVRQRLREYNLHYRTRPLSGRFFVI
jgi:hypothetical protein